MPLTNAERKRNYRRRQKLRLGLDPDGDLRGKHSNHRRGFNHPRWNAGQIGSEHGYIKVRVGKGHPLADPNGYAYEHLIVWVSAGNLLPRAGEVLHHKDEDKTNNRIENLELKTRQEHSREHDENRERDGSGRFVGKKAAGRLLDGREWNEMPALTFQFSRQA